MPLPNIDDLLFPITFGTGILGQNASSPLSGQDYANPYLQSIVESNRGFAGDLLQNFQLKTLDDVSLSDYESDQIEKVRKIAGDDKAEEIRNKILNEKLTKANEGIRAQGEGMLENFQGAQALNSLFELQDLEQLESRFASKRSFENLDDFITNPTRGIFNTGGPVGNLPRTRAYIPALDGVPVQTEVGERLLLPTGDIVESNAEKRHKDMPNDLVTDILPEGTYVFAEHSFEITKDDAEKVIVERDISPYNPFEKQKPPEDKTLVELYNKGETSLSPSELVKRINKNFEIIDADDIFTLETNAENKNNRIPYLEAVIALSELKRPTQSQEQPQQFSDGGTVRKMPVGGVIAGLGFLSGLINNRNANKKAGQLLSENLESIATTADTQNQLADIGALSSIAGILGQDFTVDAPQLSTRELEAIQTEVPQAFVDSLTNRLLGSIPTNQVFSQTGSFSRALAGLTPMYSQAAEAASNTALQMELDRLTREGKKLEGIAAVRNQQAIIDANVANQERANRNRGLTGAAGAIAGLTTTKANIAGNKAANELAARGANFAATSQLNNQFAQTLVNAGAVIGQFGGGSDPQDVTATPTTTTTTSPLGAAEALLGNRTFGIDPTLASFSTLSNKAFNTANAFLDNRTFGVPNAGITPVGNSGDCGPGFRLNNFGECEKMG